MTSRPERYSQLPTSVVQTTFARGVAGSIGICDDGEVKEAFRGGGLEPSQRRSGGRIGFQ
jgi:hypothetical protein